MAGLMVAKVTFSQPLEQAIYCHGLMIFTHMQAPAVGLAAAKQGVARGFLD
jgi:hypothetical protein